MQCNKQLLYEVEHDSKAQVCGSAEAKAEADNTNQGLHNFVIMQKPNPITVSLYNCESRLKLFKNKIALMKVKLSMFHRHVLTAGLSQVMRSTGYASIET